MKTKNVLISIVISLLPIVIASLLIRNMVGSAALNFTIKSMTFIITYLLIITSIILSIKLLELNNKVPYYSMSIFTLIIISLGYLSVRLWGTNLISLMLLVLYLINSIVLFIMLKKTK